MSCLAKERNFAFQVVSRDSTHCIRTGYHEETKGVGAEEQLSQLAQDAREKLLLPTTEAVFLIVYRKNQIPTQKSKG